MNILSILDAWRYVLLADFLRYTLTAGGAFLVFWVWRPALVRSRRLQEAHPDWARLRSEIAYSMSTVVVFSGVGLTLLYAAQAGLTRIYTDVQAHGWAYLLASVVLMIVLHDAYFYWTHRLLHWRPLYRRVHHVHHRSTSPTPWAAYAFHPVEAVVQAGVYPLIVFTIPAYPLALELFLLYMIARNVLGHLGFEIFPRGFASHPLTWWHTTPTHHDLHHRFGRDNYGLYFALWDDWLGTTQPGYREAFEAVTSRCAMTRPRSRTQPALRNA